MSISTRSFRILAGLVLGVTAAGAPLALAAPPGPAPGEAPAAIAPGTWASVVETLRGGGGPAAVRLVPAREDGGRLVGFRVFSLQRDSAWARLGVRNGDVIEAVGPVSLLKPERLAKALPQVEQGPRTVTLLRGDERIVLRVEEKSEAVLTAPLPAMPAAPRK